jgi:hypothetical protein
MMMKRWKILAALLVIFLSGVVVGSLGTGIYIKKRIGMVTRGGPGHVMHKLFLKRLTHELDLDIEQQKKIEEILHQTAEELLVLHQQTRPRAHAILDRAVDRTKDYLSPEQAERLDEIVEDMKTRRAGFFRKGRAMDRAERQELVERILSEMTGRLDLTPEQVSQIRPVMEESVETRYALIQKHRERGPWGRRQRMKENLEIDRDLESRLEQILTQQQMNAFWKSKDELRMMMHEELFGPRQAVEGRNGR